LREHSSAADPLIAQYGGADRQDDRGRGADRVRFGG
jgi:hypothetical protein